MRTIILLVVLIGMMGCSTNPPAPKVLKPEGQPLPDFNILLKDTVTRVNTKKIPTGKPLVFSFFGENCVPCKGLIGDISAHRDSLKGARLYLLSADFFHNVGVYDDTFHLSSLEDVVVGQDMPGIFFSYFGANVYPMTVVYDQQKKLKQIIVGKVSLDSIAKVIAK